MSSIMDSVNQRTQLVGENRLELLLFSLSSMQTFAINVFKVQEVVSLPRLSALPGSHSSIVGVVNMRGKTIPVINLPQAIGMKPLVPNDSCNLIITEYNRTIQGFLVGEIDQIVNTTWESIQPPPRTAGRGHYLTAITQIERENRNSIVEIIDVEKVLAEIITYDTNISDGVLDEEIAHHMQGKKVLIVDDSSTARNLVRQTLSAVGIDVVEAYDGLKALELLQGWANAGKTVTDEILMMITDAEMPEMDGYKLTSEIREDARMSNLYIALNTSLSGSFNDAMAEKVGCNVFISKFQPDRLVEVVQDCLRERLINE